MYKNKLLYPNERPGSVAFQNFLRKFISNKKLDEKDSTQ